MSDKNIKGDRFKSALHVNDGVEQPESINPNAGNKFRLQKKIKYTVDEFVKGVLDGNRTILGQAITLIESNLPEHNDLAHEIIEKCLPFTGKSIRIGITGVPGVGKSTFIESMGRYITKRGGKLAVLAVDPSSEKSKGSIMGDKTRMEELSTDSNAFIRPSPSAGSLGGVARKTRETILLCEAAGFNIVFIETVGVGQSETAVHSMVDFFLLLMLAGAGDELQGIKRGIMEMADAIAITKADGENMIKASIAKVEYQNALHLFPPTDLGWIPQVLTCSAVKKQGINEIWNTIEEYMNKSKDSNYFIKNRKEQAKYWMYESINEALKNSFYNRKGIKARLKDFEDRVLNGEMNSFFASKTIINEYLKYQKK